MASQDDRLLRPRVEHLDALLGVKLPVLNDGFVRLIDYMGSDAAIVQAARVSYGAGTKTVREDRALIRYLMRNWHTTPFEMCEIKLHVRVPMDCWRQWIRHRTANVNEYSTRYSVAIDSAQITAESAWRAQAKSNRQGSKGAIPEDVGRLLTQREAELHAHARTVYSERLDAGVAREQARKDLPLSTYTEAYWKIDLHNLLHFLRLRLDEHAQWEIRQYAQVIGSEILSKWCPLAWEAFRDYRRETLELSRIEVEVLRVLVADGKSAARRKAMECRLAHEQNGKVTATREGEALEQKLATMGFGGLFGEDG